MATAPGRRVALAAAAALFAVGAAACSGSGGPTHPAAGTPSAPAPSGSTGGATSPPTPSAAPAGRVAWLCRPGLHRDPCTFPLTATVVRPAVSTREIRYRAAPHPSVDCFYVYPTVSQSSRTNAPLRSAPEIVATVRAQAALFATRCRLFVPIYRQLTVAALTSGKFLDPAANALALADLRAAWRQYLARFNDGRGVVLIGHSQGAMQLTKLIRSDIDPFPAQRSRLVSAILLGGNVTVPTGRTVGGDFAHVPACTAATQTGCLVAYSSFATRPPFISFFGRAAAGREVVCVDPAALLHRRRILPIVPTRATSGAVLSGNLRATADVSTGYVAFPGALRARCITDDHARVLHVTGRVAGRPVSTLQTLGSEWGLHVADVNLELGDLLALVQRQSASWLAAHR